MSSFDKERRKLVRNLVLAGFSLRLFSACTTTNNEEPSGETENKGEENAESLIQKIASSANVDLFEKDHMEYSKYTQYYNLNLKKAPKTVAVVYNEKGVQEALRYAQILKLPVAIRSGGHSFEQLSSNEGGLVINLSLLKTIQWLDEDRIEIGAGAILKEVYDNIIPKKRILPMGSCGTVGVGGLTLGGGHGFFSRRLGLTCDQIESLTFVDASGKIHYHSQDKELLWGLKGGGNGNFGVVTSFVFKSSSLPSHFGSIRLRARKLDSAKAKKLLEVFFEVCQSLPKDCYASYILNSTTLTVLFTYHESSEEHILNIIDPIAEQMDEKKLSYSKDIASSLKNYYGSLNPLPFKNSSLGYYQGMGTIDHLVDEILKTVINEKLLWQIVLLGGEIQNKTFEGTSSYPHREWQYLSELQCYWNTNQTALRDKKIAAFKRIQKIVSEGGISAQYRNYPALEFENWEVAYYGENYPRLQQLKRKYDPTNLIRHPHSIRL